LPPLRDRREDLGLLISAMLPRAASTRMRFAPAALRAFLRYSWPHNVRELEQALTTAIAAGSYLWFHARGDRRPAIAVVALPGHLGFTLDHRF